MGLRKLAGVSPRVWRTEERDKAEKEFAHHNAFSWTLSTYFLSNLFCMVIAFFAVVYKYKIFKEMVFSRV